MQGCRRTCRHMCEVKALGTLPEPTPLDRGRKKKTQFFGVNANSTFLMTLSAAADKCGGDAQTWTNSNASSPHPQC